MLRLVALDMDGTLIDISSSWAAVHHHYGLSNSKALEQFLNDEIDDLEFIRSDVQLWQTKHPEIGVEDLERILAEVPLMPGAAELLRGLKARGVTTAIVSGGLDVLARRIGRDLGVDYVLANGIRVTPEGRLTDEGIVRVPIKQKDRVLAGIQRQLSVTPAETASVGNSEIDVAMFRQSRIGIAFHPEDPPTRRAATHVIDGPSLEPALKILLDDLDQGADRA